MELFRTWSATTLLPVCAERAWAELAGLLDAVWPGETDVVESAGQERLVHAVLSDGEPDVWLTWSLEGLPCGATRVVVQLDELCCGAPDPELDELLVTLLSRCAPTLAG
jgi:hypothetical protein